MTPKSFDEWWNNYDDPHGHGRLHHDAAQIGWNASRAVLLADHDVAGLVGECRALSVHASNADKIVANAKSARNQAAGDDGAEYSWLTPEQTLEGRCADALESLAAQVASLKAHANAMTGVTEENDRAIAGALRELTGNAMEGFDYPKEPK